MTRKDLFLLFLAVGTLLAILML